MIYFCFQAGLYIIIYMRSPIRELDYPNLLSGFSFLNEPENTAKMDRNKRLPVTPLMFFSLILSLSIITARYSYDYFSTRYWLIAAIIAIALAGCCYVLNENRQLFRLFFRKIKQLVLLQSFFLSLCLFCLGGFITSHHINKTKAPGSIMTYQSLSPIDRTILASRSFRQQMEQQLHAYHIDGQDFAVISAMAMGDKGSLDRETKESFSISGTSHVLAVSGLHIGIIFQLFVILLGGKRRSRSTVALSLVVVWAYVVFIGLPPSAVRSASMLSIYSFCLLALRPDLSLNTLSLAYVIMLFLNPFHLFDISFQMSFLAVASILMFYPPLFRLLKSHGKIIRCLWGLFCVSLAAQIGTLPLIVYYFGRISCYSLLTSFIAIPAATLILYLCALLLLLSPLTYISSLASVGTWLMQHIAAVLASITQSTNTAFRLTSLLPGASIDHIHLSLLQLMLLYLAVVSGYLVLAKWNQIREKIYKIRHSHALPF